MRRIPLSYGKALPLLLVGLLFLVGILLRVSPRFRAALLPPNNTQQIQDIYGNSVVSRVSLGYGDSVSIETGIHYLVHCPTDDPPANYGFHSVLDFDALGLHIYEYTTQQSDERDKAKTGKARWNGRTFGYDVNDDLDVLQKGGVYLVSAAAPFEFSCAGSGLGGGSSSSSSAGNSSSTGTSSSSSSTFVGALSCTSPVVAITPAVIPDELYGTFPYLMPGHAVWSTQSNTALLFTRFNQGKVWSFNPTTNAFTSQTFNTSTMPSGFASMTIQSAVWNPIRNEAYIFMKSGTQTRMFVYSPSSGIPQDKGALAALADVAVMDATSEGQKVYLYSKAEGGFNSYDVLTSTFSNTNNTLPNPPGTYYDSLKDQVTSAALDPEHHVIYFTASGRKNTGGSGDQEDMFIYKYNPANDSIVAFPQYLTNNATDYGGNALNGYNLIRTAPPRNEGTIAWNPHTKTLLLFGGKKETAFDTSMSLRQFANSFDPRILYTITEFDPVRGTISPRPEILPSARTNMAVIWNERDETFYLFGGGTGVETAPTYATLEGWNNNQTFQNGSFLIPQTSSLPNVEHQVVSARLCSVTQDPSTSCAQYNLPPQITVVSNQFAGSPLVRPTGSTIAATDAEQDPIMYFLSVSAPKYGSAGDGQVPNLVSPLYDVNTDSMVDIGDVNAIGSLIGLQQGQAGFNPRADLNSDGSITQADVTAFFSQTAARVTQTFGDQFSFNTTTGVITNPITPVCTGNVCVRPQDVRVTVSAYTPASCFPLRYSSIQFTLPAQP